MYNTANSTLGASFTLSNISKTPKQFHIVIVIIYAIIIIIIREYIECQIVIKPRKYTRLVPILINTAMQRENLFTISTRLYMIIDNYNSTSTLEVV